MTHLYFGTSGPAMWYLLRNWIGLSVSQTPAGPQHMEDVDIQVRTAEAQVPAQTSWIQYALNKGPRDAGTLCCPPPLTPFHTVYLTPV